MDFIHFKKLRLGLQGRLTCSGLNQILGFKTSCFKAFYEISINIIDSVKPTEQAKHLSIKFNQLLIITMQLFYFFNQVKYQFKKKNYF